MKKVAVLLILTVSLFLVSCGGTTSSTTQESGSASTTAEEEAGVIASAAEEEAGVLDEAVEEESSANQAEELAVGEWAGIWSGGDVEITITQYGDGDIYMDINDAELHTSPDTMDVDGNTIVATYIITSAMVPDADPSTFPEQMWEFTLTKNGDTIDFYRTCTLTWFSVLLEDDTYGTRVIVNENSATLVKQ